MIYKKTWKYILKKENIYNPYYRLKALKNFSDVHKNDIGGYVQSYHNLSQKGTCWIYDEARVTGCARVLGNAWIMNAATATGRAIIYDDAIISEKAHITDNAKIFEYAQVSGKSTIIGGSKVVSGSSIITEGFFTQ